MRDAAFMESVHAHEKALSFHDTADPFLVKAVSHHEIAVIVSKTRKNMNRGPKNGPKWGAIGEPKMTIMSGTVKEKDRHYFLIYRRRENRITQPTRTGRDEAISASPFFISINMIKPHSGRNGMCADVAIHDPAPPGHNPHAHILLTVRPLNKDGSWQHKTEKEYLCVRDGKEQGFTAAEFKAAQADGWEKQYLYQVGKERLYLSSSAFTDLA